LESELSKGIRQDTRNYTEQRHAADPLALGPYLGALALRFNVSAALIAALAGCHEQTVVRWMTQSSVQPVWSVKVAKVIALLAWLHDTEKLPLGGTAMQREAQLAGYVKDFQARARAGLKTKASA
jgi:hypothetical protein